MSFIISPQPASVTVVPGQDTTFTVQGSTSFSPLSSIRYTYQWFVNGSLQSGQTNNTYTIDPLMTDSGKTFRATVTVLSGTSLPLNTVVTVLSSNTVTLTVNEDVPPFDVYDRGTETGRQRHLRLRHLGYV